MKHVLFSQNQDMPVKWFEKFDKEQIKQAIVEHIELFPDDTLEHCKEYPKNSLNRNYGYEIINYYQLHNNKVCKVVLKNTKEFYKSIN